ncbi:nicotinate phosphoribosyltransferase [Nibricoccus sp. IMCC34717]|uniref:nicotinate phosphoribosyltransferase n=1 Tax=Nibricoccus sp. IMCC34717 TaxID=3034021 RepID=UPI00384AC895
MSRASTQIITTLLDTDLYKLTMGQSVYHRFPAARTKFKFKCRSPGVDLRPLKDEIEAQVDHLCSLTFTKEEIEWLSGIRFFKQSFIDILKFFRLERECVSIVSGAEQLEITVEGSWLLTILFEVPLLAIVSEVYFRSLAGSESAMRASEDSAIARLHEKLKLIKEYERTEHGAKQFRLTEFGTRRRFSKALQQKVVETLMKEVPSVLYGTSNVHLARTLGLRPIGTMAHEFLQAHQALGPRLVNSQRAALESWVQEYRGDLGIALTDVIGIDAFCRDFDLFYAKLFDGVRHDSGCPYAWSDRMLNHYETLNIDARAKSAVYSDSLDFPKALDLCRKYEGRWRTSFGIGTHLTNDVPGFKALNNVIKMTECNGQPVAKLSDTPGKTMCEDPVYLAYLKQVFQISP